VILSPVTRQCDDVMCAIYSLHSPSSFLPTTTTPSTNISSTNTMDDNIMDDNVMDNNNIDDISGAGDDWTAEEETHLTQAWLLHLLNGPDSIKVQNIIYPLLRDMEFTGDDFERVSTDLQKLGTNRDAGEIK
jgi:hypothetical protein